MIDPMNPMPPIDDPDHLRAYMEGQAVASRLILGIVILPLGLMTLGAYIGSLLGF